MMILQAIETRYLGPTNVRGSRVKATCQAGSLTLHWDHALNTDANHYAAAKALAEKLGWVPPHYGELIGGGNAKGDGNVWVLTRSGGGHPCPTCGKPDRVTLADCHARRQCSECADKDRVWNSQA